MKIKNIIKISFLTVILLVFLISAISILVTFQIRKNSFLNNQISQLILLQERMNQAIQDTDHADTIDKIDALKSKFDQYEYSFENIKKTLPLNENSGLLSQLLKEQEEQDKIIKDLTEHTDGLELTNTSSWQQFIYWCEYLGFVNKISISGETFISPDPTTAVKEELKVNFKKNITLTIKDFLIKLSANLPVLEYGYVRDKIEPMLRDGLVLPIDTLSYSTSLAILRLEQQNIIALESKSDADIITLQDGINNRRISHIRYLGQ